MVWGMGGQPIHLRSMALFCLYYVQSTLLYMCQVQLGEIFSKEVSLFAISVSVNSYIPLRWLKVAILKLPLPLPLLQTAIMEIRAIL